MMIDMLFAGALSAGTLAVVMLVIALRHVGQRQLAAQPKAYRVGLVDETTVIEERGEVA